MFTYFKSRYGIERNPSFSHCLKLKKSVLNIHWKDWCWSWNSSTLATWCEEPTHLKRSWCWERLKVRGERDNRGWDGWIASLTQWIWVWVNSRSWRWTGRPGVLQSMGSQRVEHDWATALSWSQPGGASYTPWWGLPLCSKYPIVSLHFQFFLRHLQWINVHDSFGQTMIQVLF